MVAGPGGAVAALGAVRCSVGAGAGARQEHGRGRARGKGQQGQYGMA